MISPSTQIIGEKPQTVSGPLWVIVHRSVELALVMVSHAIRRVIYAARLRGMGLQLWGQLGGRGGGPSGHYPCHSSFTSTSGLVYLPGGPKALG